MADDPSVSLPALDRVCADGVCHCDWRITLQDCEESIAMWYINVLNVAISGLTAVLGELSHYDNVIKADRDCNRNHTLNP
ncbi:hypothetical protein BJV82DRAFT_589027 [Fennellomyces sp. T-0311]|nr:hypothetical protein BJV82DRAFT_589027 [Fennellomyces sp. T-0311]